MPEYLAPGVYVEEVSFRSKSIEGVPTSTTGFAGLDPLRPGAVRRRQPPRPPVDRAAADHQLHRVRARLRRPRAARRRSRRRAADQRGVPGARGPGVLRQRRPPALRLAGLRPVDRGRRRRRTPASHRSRCAVGAGDAATWRARWPGALGNVLLRSGRCASATCAFTHATFGLQASGARAAGAVVEITGRRGATRAAADAGDLVPARLPVVDVDADVVDAVGRPRQASGAAGGAGRPTAGDHQGGRCCR